MVERLYKGGVRAGSLKDEQNLGLKTKRKGVRYTQKKCSGEKAPMRQARLKVKRPLDWLDKAREFGVAETKEVLGSSR